MAHEKPQDGGCNSFRYLAPSHSRVSHPHIENYGRRIESWMSHQYVPFCTQKTLSMFWPWVVAAQRMPLLVLVIHTGCLDSSISSDFACRLCTSTATATTIATDTANLCNGHWWTAATCRIVFRPQISTRSEKTGLAFAVLLPPLRHRRESHAATTRSRTGAFRCGATAGQLG